MEKVYHQGRSMGGTRGCRQSGPTGDMGAMDGPDNIAYLQSMHYCGRLNEEIEGLEGVTHVVGGLQRTMVVCPTSDGKGRQIINPGRGGNKCWLCRDDKSLDVCHRVRETLWWGACYKQVPPIRRVGDFNYASLRILNCFSKRLRSEVKGWGGNG